jgi:hypothetical protein
MGLHHQRNWRQGKIMASVFWDSGGVIHVDFLPHGVTINAQYYINLLHNDVQQAILKKKKTWETVKNNNLTA